MVNLRKLLGLKPPPKAELALQRTPSDGKFYGITFYTDRYNPGDEIIRSTCEEVDELLRRRSYKTEEGAKEVVLNVLGQYGIGPDEVRFLSYQDAIEVGSVEEFGRLRETLRTLDR